MEIHASSKKPLTIFELIQPALVAIYRLESVRARDGNFLTNPCDFQIFCGLSHF